MGLSIVYELFFFDATRMQMGVVELSLDWALYINVSHNRAHEFHHRLIFNHLTRAIIVLKGTKRRTHQIPREVRESPPKTTDQAHLSIIPSPSSQSTSPYHANLAQGPHQEARGTRCVTLTFSHSGGLLEKRRVLYSEQRCVVDDMKRKRNSKRREAASSNKGLVRWGHI